MNAGRREQINRMAEKTLEILNLQPPVNVELAVCMLGGRIEEEEFLDAFCDGAIRNEAPGFVIAVRPSLSKARRNFTIAHELGHLILHTEYFESDGTNFSYNRKGISADEYEANEFAAAFLMPRESFQEQVKKHTDGKTVSTPEIAKYFGVSLDAASTRGKWLGYFVW